MSEFRPCGCGWESAKVYVECEDHARARKELEAANDNVKALSEALEDQKVTVARATGALGGQSSKLQRLEERLERHIDDMMKPPGKRRGCEGCPMLRGKGVNNGQDR